jgi:hypothetical protein
MEEEKKDYFVILCQTLSYVVKKMMEYGSIASMCITKRKNTVV